MGLKIIGSGFGRTGTMSTKLALEILGFGPCHHMIEVMQSDQQMKYWADIVAGELVNWTKVFEGFNSQVDFPGAAVWEKLIHDFPDAKVLHTERPEEEWWASYSKTIGKFFFLAPTIPLPPPIAANFRVMDKLIIQDIMGGFDRDKAIAAYRKNNARVREIVPKDRLLVFSPSDGWEPLCRLLGVKVPNEPFPKTHKRDEFWAHFGGEPADPVS